MWTAHRQGIKKQLAAVNGKLTEEEVSSYSSWKCLRIGENSGHTRLSHRKFVVIGRFNFLRGSLAHRSVFLFFFLYCLSFNPRFPHCPHPHLSPLFVRLLDSPGWPPGLPWRPLRGDQPPSTDPEWDVPFLLLRQRHVQRQLHRGLPTAQPHHCTAHL